MTENWFKNKSHHEFYFGNRNETMNENMSNLYDSQQFIYVFIAYCIVHIRDGSLCIRHGIQTNRINFLPLLWLCNKKFYYSFSSVDHLKWNVTALHSFNRVDGKWQTNRIHFDSILSICKKWWFNVAIGKSSAFNAKVYA